jgi:excisionase family DNA binding protein
MLNSSEAPARLIAQRFAPHPIVNSSPEPQKLSLNARIAALPWRANKRGEKVMLSLSEAAMTAGIAKSTIWRAVKAGRISATRTGTGTYQIDPAELFRVFPAMPKNVEMKPPRPAMETGIITALESQISALKEISSLLKEQLGDIRKDRDAWRTQAESNQRLLADARPPRRGLFGWRKA